MKAIAWLLGAVLVQGTLRSAPKVLWHRAYNGSGEESHPHFVIETRDGGFLMVVRPVSWRTVRPGSFGEDRFQGKIEMEKGVRPKRI